MTTYPVPERALLCRPALLPDESLGSYLQRLADANAYVPFSLFTGLCQRRLAALGVRDNLVPPQRPETFAVLAALAHLSPRVLANASLHSFMAAPLLQGRECTTVHLTDGLPLALLTPFWRTRYMLPSDHAQFCPDCLRAAAYQRRAWVLTDVSACLRHRRVLRDRCPQCDARVAVQDVVRRQCQRCGASLTSADQESALTPVGAVAQSVAQTWWGLPTPVVPTAEWPLLAQPFPSFYRLFRFLTERYNAGMARDHGAELPPAARHRAQVAAFSALTNWPVGFTQFLEVCLRHDVQVQSTYYGQDFSLPVYLQKGALLDVWVQHFWECEGFEFVRDALANFFETHHLQLCHENRRLHLLIQCEAELQQLASRLAQPQQERMAQLVEHL